MASVVFNVVIFVAACVFFQMINANPAIGGFDNIGACITNCAQCKKMLGAWFQAELCADSCLQYKGRLIPDCQDIASISPFLVNRLE